MLHYVMRTIQNETIAKLSDSAPESARMGEERWDTRRCSIPERLAIYDGKLSRRMIG